MESVKGALMQIWKSCSTFVFESKNSITQIAHYNPFYQQNVGESMPLKSVTIA